jgi:pyroglutamyl-peptidase
VIVVTGFGPFLDVDDNPSGQLARGCHGLRVQGETLVGRVIDASYVGGIQETIRIAQGLSPRLVLGTGLSRRASASRLERFAYSDYSTTLLDVDDQVGRPPAGPERVESTVNLERLAASLEVELSTEPGRYVCNAWLYEVSRALKGVPVGFLHIPSEGFEVGRLLKGLQTYLDGGASV